MFLAHGEPAAGAPTEDLIAASIVGAVLVALLAVFGWAHRTGRTKLLARAADLSEGLSGLPRWAALPAGITGVSLLVAVYGFYWDVATHIDNGRDPGPFANPAHFLIIFGLAGIALAGLVAILIGRDESVTSVRIRGDWHAPVGGVLLLVCGGIAVLGFPLDDVWHRLFGQDVTLWSPTHVQMVGGAALSTLALWVLHVEGTRALPRHVAVSSSRLRLFETFIAGAVLIGFSAFHAEFDYSVPQFRLVYQPILLMMSAGAALVAARMRLGAGGALKAVAFFLVIRGIVSLIVGPVLDHTTLHFPLYIAEALAVEAVARWLPRLRGLSFGLGAGAALGVVGLAAEWGWSHVWMTMAWHSTLLPEAVILGMAAALAGGALGSLIGGALSSEPVERASVTTPRVVAALAACVLLLSIPFRTTVGSGGSVDVALDKVEGPHGLSANAQITVRPAALAENADWLNVTSWQGGGSVVTELERKGPGIYETPVPIPIHGEWKALIRLARDDAVVAVPVFLPKDPAIPAQEVPATTRFTREFVLDKEIVLREARDVSSVTTYSASGALLLIALAWIVTLAWGFARIKRSDDPDASPGDLSSGRERRRTVDAADLHRSPAGDRPAMARSLR